MKKKLILLVAIMVLILAACSLLVACAPDADENGGDNGGGNDNQQEVVYNTPQEFLDNFYLNSNNSIIYTQAMGDNTANTFIGMHGNNFVMKNNDVVSSYFEFVNNSLVEYKLRNGEWRVSTTTKEEIDAVIGEVGQNKYMNTLLIGYIMNDSHIKLFMDSVKESSNFEQKDGWYVGKESTNVKDFSYKIIKDELIIKFESSGVTATFTFKNGCEEIVIPADAKDSNN